MLRKRPMTTPNEALRTTLPVAGWGKRDTGHGKLTTDIRTVPLCSFFCGASIMLVKAGRLDPVCQITVPEDLNRFRSLTRVAGSP